MYAAWLCAVWCQGALVATLLQPWNKKTLRVRGQFFSCVMLAEPMVEWACQVACGPWTFTANWSPIHNHGSTLAGEPYDARVPSGQEGCACPIWHDALAHERFLLTIASTSCSMCMLSEWRALRVLHGHTAGCRAMCFRSVDWPLSNNKQSTTKR